MRIACQPVVVEKLFLEEVNEESSNSAWCRTGILEVQNELVEAGKQMMVLYCA